MISKPELKELLNYHFSNATLRAFAKSIDPDAKPRSKLEAVEIICARTENEKILRFIFQYFHASRHNTFLFELSESEKFSEASLKKAIQKHKLDGMATYAKAGSDGLSFELIMPAQINAQALNPETGEITGKMKRMTFQLPVKICFHAPKYLKIKFFKFAPGSNHALSTGEIIHINEILFAETTAIEKFQESIVNMVSSEDFVETNLISGFKELIKNKKLNAIVASADDEDNEGEDRRVKHKTNNGQFLEDKFLDERILKSDKIKRGKWFWIEGVDPRNARPEDLPSLTIDPCIGLCSKDTSNEDDFEWIIDEILKRNS